MQNKKLVPFFLSFLLVGGGLSPSTLKATSRANAVDDPIYVCEIEETGKKYESVSDACSELIAGQTINMLADSGETLATQLKVNSILNLNEFTITYKGTGYFNVCAENLTINATTGGISGAELPYSSSFMYQVDYTNQYLTINGGNYVNFGFKYSKDSISHSLSDKTILDDFLSHLVINSGKFTFPNEQKRNNLALFVNSDSIMTKSEILDPEETYFRVLEAKTTDFVENLTTDASLMFGYGHDKGYWRPATCADLVSGAKFIFAKADHNGDYFNQIRTVKGMVKILDLARYSSFAWTEGKHYLGSGEETNSHGFYTSIVNDQVVFKGPVASSAIATVVEFTPTAGTECGTGFIFTNYEGNIVAGNEGTDQFITYYSKEQIDEYIEKGVDNYHYSFTYRDGEVSMDSRYVAIDQQTIKMGSKHRGYLEFPSTNTENSRPDVMKVYVYEEDEYTIDEASLRVGKCMDKASFDFITNSTEFESTGGVRVIYATKEYLDGEELTEDNASGDVKMQPVRVNAPNASEEDENGNYYQFGLVFEDIPRENFANVLVVRIKFCFNGRVLYTQEREISICSLAGEYVTNHSTEAGVKEHLGVLEYISGLDD